MKTFNFKLVAQNRSVQQEPEQWEVRNFQKRKRFKIQWNPPKNYRPSQMVQDLQMNIPRIYSDDDLASADSATRAQFAHYRQTLTESFPLPENFSNFDQVSFLSLIGESFINLNWSTKILSVFWITLVILSWITLNSEVLVKN